MDDSLIVAMVMVGAAVIAFEFRISSAILEILAGIVLAYFLVDIAQQDWLRFLSNLGMLGLMFMVGFEVDVERLRGTWRASILIGVSALLLPMAGVFATAYYLFDLPVLTSGLLSIGLSTTSLALVYNALRERGTLHTERGQVMIAAASVVDVLSMIFLALLMGDVGWGTAIFLLVAVPMILGLPRFGKWIFRRYRGSLVEFELRFLLVLLLSMGFMAEKIGGIHPAVIAFALGIVMSEIVDEHEELEQKLKGIVFSFLAPAFFLHAGMQLDVRLLSPDLIWMALAFIVVACGLKYIGAAVPFRLLFKRSGHVVGLLFNYRLSFGIITATVGLNVGILSENLYAVILITVIAAAFLPAILLRDRPAEWE
ncbi:MAG: cation:proton antiporter [Rickettsiales bacterium]|jgi:glutathione-regulated potassium-efflux system ancillary protein KefC